MHNKSVLPECSAERFLWDKMQRQINHTRSDRRPDKAGEQQAAEIAGREARMPQAPSEIVRLADHLKRLADRLLPCEAPLILQVLGAG